VQVVQFSTGDDDGAGSSAGLSGTAERLTAVDVDPDAVEGRSAEFWVAATAGDGEGEDDVSAPGAASGTREEAAAAVVVVAVEAGAGCTFSSVGVLSSQVRWSRTVSRLARRKWITLFQQGSDEDCPVMPICNETNDCLEPLPWMNLQ